MDAIGQFTDFMNDQRRDHVTGIIGRIGQRLIRFIRARVASEADAEDILQDVWQKLVTTLDEGPVEEVGAWLYTVARNRITDQYRKPRMASLDGLAAERESDDDSFDLTDFFLRDDQTPEKEYLKNLFWEQLHAALAELPPEQRAVFIWHELEGLSFQDIAALTGENVNTLLSRKRYAMLGLRQRLDRLHDEFLS
jgi:RNA polymerase sigma factor (sigma-70 family)